MPNMSLKKVGMSEQDPTKRNKNFHEVALGYTEEQAIEEAQRCLQCKHRPCVTGCPVYVYIPEFIDLVAKGDFKKAYEVVKSTNALPAVCGRVCPQEDQCEKFCVRAKKGEPVAVGRLERFVADWYMKNVKESETEIENHTMNGKKVAIIGAGPAGLTCAGDLADKGYDVMIFEAFHAPGGVLVYGIPEFRLPKELVGKEIKTLFNKGVNIMTNMVIGKVLSIKEIMEEEGYDAVFISSGAGLPSFMNIPGENLNGVYSANEFLTRVNLMKAYEFPYTDTPIRTGKNVAVVGGGNVAMDAARSAKRLGAENVYIIYRRAEEQMPARIEEVHHAKEEGIEFYLLNNPIEILGEDGWVKGVRCIKMKLGEPDESGRRRPIPIKGSEYDIELDTIIIAIGQSPNPLIRRTTPGLDVESWGGIIVDEKTGKTSIEGVYAGGDVVTGAATVILAMGAGKKAADAIDEYLKGK